MVIFGEVDNKLIFLTISRQQSASHVVQYPLNYGGVNPLEIIQALFIRN